MLNSKINFLVTKGRTKQIPESVFDSQITQLNRVLEYRQASLKEIEAQHQSASDKQRNFEQAIPLVNALKDFWETFRNAKVCSNHRGKDDDLLDMPIDSDRIESLRTMIDILVESFSIDSQNNIIVELSIPILDSIAEDSLHCRQLTNIPSP